MLKFKDFLYLDDLDRLVEGIDDYQPQDGHWQEPLSSSNSYSTYKFNVPGDDCGTSHNPCYAVTISGSPSNTVSISFSRDGSYSDQHLGVGMTVFKGVLKAMSEYIKALKPAGLSWSAVTKSVPNPKTGKIINPEARAHVYEGWAVRNLFPDKYVGMQGNWIRRDLYDSQYVQNGYPPVPEDLTAESPSGVKTAVLEKMKETAEANRREIQQREYQRQEEDRRRQAEEDRRRREEEAVRRQEQERITRERLAAALTDEQQNPQHLKEGDVVYIDGHVSHVSYRSQELPAKIIGFRMGGEYGNSEDQLHVQVQFAADENTQEFDGAIYFIDARQLRKESSEFAAQREQRRQERLAGLISNPEINPHGVREGDDIITSIEGATPDNEQNGLLGKITRFKPGNEELSAYVDWDDHAKQVLARYLGQAVSVKHLRKATPEVRQEIERERREREIERQVQASRNRTNRRQTADEPQSAADIEALVNHPANPQHFRPGDLVKVNGWRHNGRGGVIVSLERPYWSEDNISANVRFHGSRAARPTRVWSLTELERDTSPQAQALQARQQRQQERQQRVAQGTNGLQIGDTITVASGVHRGKTGRILSFRTSGQNITAVVASHEGNFNVNVRAIANNAQPVAAESLSFFRYYLDRNEVI